MHPIQLDPLCIQFQCIWLYFRIFFTNSPISSTARHSTQFLSAFSAVIFHWWTHIVFDIPNITINSGFLRHTRLFYIDSVHFHPSYHTAINRHRPKVHIFYDVSSIRLCVCVCVCVVGDAAHVRFIHLKIFQFFFINLSTLSDSFHPFSSAPISIRRDLSLVLLSFLPFRQFNLL